VSEDVPRARPIHGAAIQNETSDNRYRYPRSDMDVGGETEGAAAESSVPVDVERAEAVEKGERAAEGVKLAAAQRVQRKIAVYHIEHGPGGESQFAGLHAAALHAQRSPGLKVEHTGFDA